MAKLIVTAQNKRGQTLNPSEFLAIYEKDEGGYFTGNKTYPTVVKAIRANDKAVGAIMVSDWLDLAKSGGIDEINAALANYVA
jgi:hypothetical protein